MTTQSKCILWRISMLAITIALIWLFVTQVKHDHATNYESRIHDSRESIFEILQTHDPARDQYNAYQIHEDQVLNDLKYWADEWAALEPGTVIGKRRGAAMWYTGYPKEIDDNITELRKERDFTLTRERRNIVLDRIETQGSIIENFKLDPTSQPAQDLTTLLTQHNEVIRQMKNDPLKLPVWAVIPITLAPFFMVLYSFTGYIPPAWISKIKPPL